jgi:hypothetical protein
MGLGGESDDGTDLNGRARVVRYIREQDGRVDLANSRWPVRLARDRCWLLEWERDAAR